MKRVLINFIKFNPLMYDLFYYIGSTFIKTLGFFIKTNDDSILFMSFGGKKFNDSPKALYDYICNEPYFDKFKLIWAFNEPNDYNLNRGEKVRVDSFDFFKVALSSKYWICNSAIERGLNFKKKSTFYVNTWHGTPLKYIGTDAISTSSKSGLGSKDIYTQNIMTAQSNFDSQIFSRLFKIKSENILICDLPRNDVLSNYNKAIIENIKSKLKIDQNKKVILYAPTYREYLRDKNNFCFLNPPITIEKWVEKLGNDYIILFRAHYEVSKSMNFNNNLFIDVSNYDDLNELMIISDMLISDYSSIYIDYSILEKPILCFAYDYDEYNSKRGLYIDLRKELPCEVAYNEDTLLTQILNIDFESAQIKTKAFKNKYIYYTGQSCKTIIQEIMKWGV